MEASKLDFSWGRERVLNEVSCRLDTGSSAVLLGPSGEGKTTLIKILAGVIQPSRGSLGIASLDDSLSASSGHWTAWMPQEDLLLPWRTTIQNALLGVPSAQRGDPAVVARAMEWLARVGLGEQWKTYPHQLSRGMRQRVSLVRTLMMGRPFLLLDEPCSALDLASRLRVFELLQERLAAGQIGLLMVSHQEQDAELLQARRWMLGAGRLTCI